MLGYKYLDQELGGKDQKEEGLSVEIIEKVV